MMTIHCVSSEVREYSRLSTYFLARLLVFLTALGAWLCLALACEAQEPYFVSPSVADIVSIGFVGDLSMSPDGDAVVYAATSAAQTSKSEIYVKTLRGRAPAVRVAEGSQPRWSPDGRSIAYYCVTGEGLQICLFDRPSGTPRQLTHIANGIIRDAGVYANQGVALDLVWSPDSTRIAFSTKPEYFSLQEPQQTESLKTQPKVFSNNDMDDPLEGVPGFPNGLGLQPCNRPHSFDNFAIGRSCGFLQILILDIRTGTVKQLTTDEEQHFQPTWSPDSRTMWCVTVAQRHRGHLGLPQSRLVQVDSVSGAERVLVGSLESKIRPRFSPDGKMLAFEESGAGEYKPWSVVVVRTDGKIVLDTRRSVDRNVVEFAWASDSKAIVLNIRDGVRQRLVRLDIGGQIAKDIPLETNWVTGFSMGPNNKMAFLSEGGDRVNEIRIANDDGNYMETLLQLDPEVANWRLGKQEIVQWQNSQGEQLEGVLVLPTNYVAGRKYPLIVDVRGSQDCDCFQRDRWDANQLLAQHGYALFYPVLRPFYYPTMFTYGDQFHRFVPASESINVMVDDLTTGVKELIKRGVTQRGQVGVMGFSVGGYGALEMASHSDLFSGVVAASSVYSDWSSEYLLFSDSVDLRSRIRTTIWNSPDLYRELSIVYSLNRIKAPTLLLGGDHDEGSIEGIIEIFNGLREVGTPVQLVRYPDQGHQISGASLEDNWKRVVDFFDLHLKNVN